MPEKPPLTIQVFDRLPQASRQIRQQVFVDEQGFTEEFDATDDIARHVLAFDGQRPVANARTYYSAEKGRWVIGRVAVLPDYRGGTGSVIMRAAEDVIRAEGGDVAWLSAQKPVIPFYEKLGYQGVGEFFMDQHCPHRWMWKALT